MRRVRAFLAVVCLLLTAAFLLACGDSTEGPASAATEQPAVPAETPLPIVPVELYGQTVESDLDILVLSEPVGDLLPLSEALAQLPECRSVQLTRSFDPALSEGGLAAFEREWAELKLRYPDIAFTDTLLIGGEPSEALRAYAMPATASLSDEVRTVAALCPALETLDLSETAATSEAVAAAEQDMPGVRILWTDAVYGASASDTASLAFSGEQDPETLSAYLGCFPGLSEVDLSETTLSDEQMNAIADRCSSVVFHRTVLLNGTPWDSFTEELDLSGAQIESYEAFSDAVGRFPKLKKLALHDCSLSNEQLAALRDRYPDAGVVWTVRFDRWSVATDAIAFSTMQNSYTTNRKHTEDVQVLRYCRDLIALDLGHNDIEDIGWITELKNLQVLILADNWSLKDVTPIGTLTKLKYLELFMNIYMTDITPLANLSELVDVNLVVTGITDITPLLSCKKLERIWLGEVVVRQIGEEGVAALQNAFPNAEYDLVSAGSTKRGWREHPRYYAYMEMFETNQPVAPFLP
ncbi:MAG: hypothetical protein IJK54_06735 [Clostridia bacterium]|nr:hypothetical protein [Clostridia bacterium]